MGRWRWCIQSLFHEMICTVYLYMILFLITQVFYVNTELNMHILFLSVNVTYYHMRDAAKQNVIIFSIRTINSLLKLLFLLLLLESKLLPSHLLRLHFIMTATSLEWRQHANE